MVLLVQGIDGGSRVVALERPLQASVNGAVAGRTGTTDASQAPDTQAPAQATPQRVRIPRIGVSAPVVDLGLRDDGTVEVPSRPERVGWFSLGPSPGSVGSSVLLGHVDSVDGPAVFARLAELRTGDRVEVDLDEGVTQTFEVAEVVSYLNEDFPANRVYAGQGVAGRGGRSLNLVTCGGEYDPDRGGYQSNVVVYTRHTTD